MFLGIDCGATRTKASLFDRDLNRVARAVCGPGNPASAPARVVEENISRCIKEVLGVGGGHVDVIAFSVAGLSSVGPDFYVAIVRKLGLEARVEVFEDFVVAHYSCFRGCSGATYIAGTGSSLYAIDDEGRCVKIGGWGHLVGDEGSGFHVGREGIRAALACLDGRGPPTALCLRLFEYLGIEAPEEVIAKIYGAASPKELIAGFARIVVEEARRGDEVAMAIIEEAAREIARAFEAVHKLVGVKSFCIVGGLYENAKDLIRPLVKRELSKSIPGCVLVDQIMDLERAAVELALKKLGLS